MSCNCVQYTLDVCVCIYIYVLHSMGLVQLCIHFEYI